MGLKERKELYKQPQVVAKVRAEQLERAADHTLIEVDKTGKPIKGAGCRGDPERAPGPSGHVTSPVTPFTKETSQMSNNLRRYYIHAEIATGDADGLFSFDLFVDSGGRHAAFTAWERHFVVELADYGRPDKVVIFELPPICASGVIGWTLMPQTTLTGKGYTI